VAIVVAGERFGGAERGALDLAQYLRDAEGAAVTLVALDDRPGRARRLAVEAGLDWTVVPVPWTGSRQAKLLALARFAGRMRRLRADALVGLTNLPNVVTGLTWRAAGASTAIWTQCDVNGSTRVAPSLFRRALLSTPLAVTWADHTRDWLVAGYGADPARIHVVPQQVVLLPPVRTGAAWRADLGVGEDDLVGCMLAHFHPGKDHLTALHAWRLVVDALAPEGVRPVLVLAGRDDGTEASAKALAFDLRLRDHVRFPGEVADVGGLLDAADLAVFCSEQECLPRGVTEPLLRGLPAAGSDIPGVREAVGAAGARFLAPPHDAPALAEAILALLRDPSLREAAGRAGRELVLRRHGGAQMPRRYVDLLAERL
jgi:glycosyltransferase involved in cell wall biosynthesis